MFDFFFQKIANLVKFRLEKNFSNSFVKNWQNLREKNTEVIVPWQLRHQLFYL
jgi:hypothetical protein